MLVLCVLTSFRVSSLFGQWVRLEVNMLCFLPLILRNGELNTGLAGIKYFVSQRMASVIFLIGLLLVGNLGLVQSFMGLIIVFKMGVPPFHSWLLRVLRDRRWAGILGVFTVQKVIPLVILSHLGVRGSGLLLIVGFTAAMVLTRLELINSFYLLLFLSGSVNRL